MKRERMVSTEFGKAVKKARIDTGQTLLSMSKELGITPSVLCSMETGRRRINKDWICKIQGFFEQKGCAIPDLDKLAFIANKEVPIDGLSLKHQMLVAELANPELTTEDLKKISELLEKINNQRKN